MLRFASFLGALLLSTASLASSYIQTTSFPSGVQVSIDGVLKGVTPIKVLVTVGNHAVLFTPPGTGWNSFSTTVTALASKTVSVDATLTPSVTAGPAACRASRSPE